MIDNDSALKLYLREISQVPLLRREEEVELAHRIQKGDAAARQKMIQANLRLVVKIAHDYSTSGLPLLDLISEGNIGLMKAVDRFDPSKGGKLSTYAAWWIKQGIKRALANQSKTIRLPAHLVDKIAKMRRAQHELTEKFGRDPTDQEIADRLKIPRTTVAQWQTLTLKPTSLDAPIGDDQSSEYADIVGDENSKSPFDAINDRQLKEEVEGLLGKLDTRERDILKYRYGLKGAPAETLEIVGKRFRITRERVRQIQNTALGKLKAMLEEQDRPKTGKKDRHA